MPPPSLRRRSYALTDVGRRRPHNEDAFLADDTLGLYVVADGVGGRAKGEVASAESVELVRGYVLANLGPLLELERDDHIDRAEVRLSLRRLVESAVQNACYVVHGMAEQDPSGRGMSTTISALLVVGDDAAIAQVGDSRVYRLHAGAVTLLTRDHNLANLRSDRGLPPADPQQARRELHKITRAVGIHDYVEVDTSATDLHAGDRYLLCTDGLHGAVGERELAGMLAEPTVEAVARRAVETANHRGGRDNVTVLVVSLG